MQNLENDYLVQNSIDKIDTLGVFSTVEYLGEGTEGTVGTVGEIDVYVGESGLPELRKSKSDLKQTQRKLSELRNHLLVIEEFFGVFGVFGVKYPKSTDNTDGVFTVNHEDVKEPITKLSHSIVKRYLQKGVKHREDGPCIEYKNSDIEYWVQGKLHRENGPAVIRNSGLMVYYKEGVKHRVDGPCVELPGLFSQYFLNGECHRLDGPAIIKENISTVEIEGQEVKFPGIEYWVQGKRHRDNKPAVISLDGSYSFYSEGVKHRVDGPAVMNSDGTFEYWLNGVRI